MRLFCKALRITLTPALLLLWLLPWAATVAQEQDGLHHDLDVTIDPGRHFIRVSDRISFSRSPARELRFSLHRGLDPVSPDEGVRIEAVAGSREDYLQHYRLQLPPGVDSVTLEYQGTIHHPLEAYGREQARGFRDTPGLISAEGVYLSGRSGWVPAFGDSTWLRFRLRVTLPQGWSAVSQGERVATAGSGGEAWQASQPQEEVYLIAAPFTEYRGDAGGIDTMVFLREPDAGLAQRYLDATAHYLALYEKLFGDYPYAKFALVENFWETGFGMPSFTLLGPRVIRLPFILHSSYPHEILHNWWGNGVYVDYRSGNWSEGLTAYLADHLVKEQQGQGADYRQQALQKYSDYAATKRDFPLREFRGRHSSASEAIGYGKVLMLFHMLRRELGDELFIEGLRRFYAQQRFRVASWSEVQAAFEAVSGKQLDAFFSQWLERTGAPLLAVAESAGEPTPDGYRLRFELRQQQAGGAYSLRVPLAVTLAGREAAWQGEVVMRDKRQAFTLELPARPLRLDVDPEYDLFRRLTAAETPPAFTESFGSSALLVVVPGDADAALRDAYRAFAGSVKNMGPDEVTIRSDGELEALPADTAVMMLGWENRFRAEFEAALQGRDIRITPQSVRLGDDSLPAKAHTFAIASRRGSAPISLVASDSPKALAGLARKLPHYHKYSYLTFAGDEPEIRAKGRWQLTDSPLSVPLEGGAARGALVDRAPLAMP